MRFTVYVAYLCLTCVHKRPCSEHASLSTGLASLDHRRHIILHRWRPTCNIFYANMLMVSLVNIDK